MANIYELTGQFLTLISFLEDPDIDPEVIQDTMESLSFEIEEKLKGYGMIIKNLEADVEALDKEEKRLDARKKVLENRIEHLKRNIVTSMEAMDKKKVQTDLFSFTLRPPAKSLQIMDEEKIPRDFRIKQPDKIDNKALISFLKKEGDKDYAILVDGKTGLLIK